MSNVVFMPLFGWMRADSGIRMLLGTNEKLYLFSGLIMAGLKTAGVAPLSEYDFHGNDDETDNAGGVSAAAIQKELREFKISDVFDLYKGKRLTKANQLTGDTPFIGSTANDNGVTGYIGQKPYFEGNAITVSYNGSVGQVFYQERPFWASDDVNVLYLKGRTLDRELFGYLGASLYRAGRGFSYTFKWNLERMRDTMFMLPIQTDAAGQPVIDPAKAYHPDGFLPDWEYMSASVRTIETLVVKDAADFIAQAGVTVGVENGDKD